MTSFEAAMMLKRGEESGAIVIKPQVLPEVGPESFIFTERGEGTKTQGHFVLFLISHGGGTIDV